MTYGLHVYRNEHRWQAWLKQLLHIATTAPEFQLSSTFDNSTHAYSI